jgi:hypothetical protein
MADNKTKPTEFSVATFIDSAHFLPNFLSQLLRLLYSLCVRKDRT